MELDSYWFSPFLGGRVETVKRKLTPSQVMSTEPIPRCDVPCLLAQVLPGHTVSRSEAFGWRFFISVHQWY
jgi:hypothetical protein